MDKLSLSPLHFSLEGDSSLCYDDRYSNFRLKVFMAQISTNEFKAGVKIESDGHPYTIISNEFVKPGKGQSFNRVRLKHLLTGRTIERTFKSGDKCEIADVVETEMRMLYKEADGIVFMDESSFEQIKIPAEQIGDTIQWLMEDLIYEIIIYRGVPVTVEPPIFMEMTITETTPGERGDTSGRVLKPATTESGAKIQVPIFVKQGERIKIDTRTGEYVSRVN
jgi:elongation factor P